MKTTSLPKLNKTIAVLAAACLITIAASYEAQAAKPDRERPSEFLAVITDAEPDLDAKTIRITGDKFAEGDAFIGSVELYLAETGITPLTVDSYAKGQTAAGVAFEQLVVSARVTKSGSAIAQSGDYIGRIDVDSSSANAPLNIIIDTVVP